MPVLLQEYPLRQLSHTHWVNHDTYNQADAALLGVLPLWVTLNAGVAIIQTQGKAPELLAGVRNFGALLESIIPRVPTVIRPTAGGAVIYDRVTDRL